MNRLLVFAKAPRPALVKTRLARSLGDERACAAYRALLEALGANLRSLEATVVFSPRDAEPELRPYLPKHWDFAPQVGRGLGERLRHGFSRAFAAGSGKVAAIGVDCPFLLSSDVTAAWRALDGAEVVFGPAADGGYWLLGMTGFFPGLFSGIDWSTERVLSQSLARARALGLRAALLRELRDVDTAADWELFLSTRDVRA